MASGATRIVTFLGQFHHSCWCFSLWQFYSFKWANSDQQGPWPSQPWIHILGIWKNWVKTSDWPLLSHMANHNQSLQPEIENYYWSSLGHMPTLRAWREECFDCWTLLGLGRGVEKYFSKIMDSLFKADKKKNVIMLQEKKRGCKVPYIYMTDSVMLFVVSTSLIILCLFDLSCNESSVLHSPLLLCFNLFPVSPLFFFPHKGECQIWLAAIRFPFLGSSAVLAGPHPQIPFSPCFLLAISQVLSVILLTS